MAYKVFTNGSPLPASDLNTYLMNQSVMVFANSTARSAALTSPTEGMVTYLEDTNKLEVYTGAAWVDVNDNAAAIPKSTVTTAGDLIIADGNASVTRLGIGANGSIPRVASGALGYLPIGTTGQVLTVSGGAPTWATPSGGGLELISTTGLSGASVVLSSIPQTYINLYLSIENFQPSTDGANVNMTWNSHTTYRFVEYSETVSTNQAFSEASITITAPADNTVVSNFAKVLINDYTSSRWKIADLESISVNQGTNTNFNLWLATGFSNLTAAITSITLKPSAGNFSSGTVKLYGVK